MISKHLRLRAREDAGNEWTPSPPEWVGLPSIERRTDRYTMDDDDFTPIDMGCLLVSVSAIWLLAMIFLFA